MRSYLTELGIAVRAGSITAVRWITAPLIVVVVFAALGFGAYDYYVTRTSNRELIAAVNSGKLAQIIVQQAQQAQQKAQQQPAPQAPAK